MTKQNMSSIPDKNRIEELLGNMQPVPSMNYYKKKEQVDWRNKQPNQEMRAKTLQLRLVSAMAVILVLTTLAITPQGARGHRRHSNSSNG